jgi:hypothetical protein
MVQKKCGHPAPWGLDTPREWTRGEGVNPYADHDLPTGIFQPGYTDHGVPKVKEGL